MATGRPAPPPPPPPPSPGDRRSFFFTSAVAQRKLGPSKRKRSRPMALARRDWFGEALTLFELNNPGADGEVVVSSTVRDLVIGSGIVFLDRGEHAFKGVPDRWRVYAVDEPLSP